MFVQSQSGSIEIQTPQDVNGVAESIFLQGLLGSQLVAQGNFVVYAEDLFQGYAATTSASSLLHTTLTSVQNVDFTAADSIIARADNQASISATNELYVAASGDTGSSVTVISSADITLDIDDTTTFSAFAIHFDSVEQTLTSSTLSVSSLEKFAVGSDATQSVFIDSVFNNVEFSVSEGAAGELGSAAFVTKFTTASTASISSSNDIKVISTNIKVEGNDVSFEADTYIAYALTANGRLLFTGDSGTNMSAGINVNFAARDELFIGYSFVDVEIENDLDAVFSQDFSVSADSQITLTGGALTVNGNDITYDADGNVVLTGGDYVVSTVVGDIYFSSTNQQSFNSLDASFTSTRGDIKINALESVLFSSVLTTTFDSSDDLSIISYGDKFTVSSAGDLIFNLTPESDGVDGLSSFIVGLDYDFTSPVFFFAGDDLLYSAGYDMQISSFADSTLTAPEILFKTFSNEPLGGIYLSATNILAFIAKGGDITFDSASTLTFSSSFYNFVTRTFSFVSSQSVGFGANDNVYINASSLFKTHSDGELNLSAEDVTTFNSTGDIAYSANHDINFETYGINVASNEDINYVGGDIIVNIQSSYFELSNDFNVTATNPGSVLSTYTRSSSNSYNADDFTFNTENLFISVYNQYGDQADGNLAINTNDITLNARQLTVSVTGDFDLQAGSIEYGTDKFISSFTASSEQLTLTAGNEVAFTSEGDITWNVNAGDTFVTTHDLYLQSSNSQGFYSHLDINFLAVGGDNDIQVLSNGGAQLIARNGDINITSDNDVLWKAQRSLIFRTNFDGIFLFAEDGNFLVDSAASILYEASDAVDLIAYNPDGTASANFIAEDGILLQSDRNGISFKAEGFVPGSADGIFINSKALHGDVIFTSNDGEIIMTTPGAITFTTDAKANLISAYDSTYTSLNDLSFSALKGGFNFDANTGVSITAGSDGNPSNLNILQPKSFYSIATSQINIHSEGPVSGNAIEIVSDFGSIQFVTSDVSDIYLHATNDQTFTGGKNYKLESNEDIQATTPGGPIIFQAQTNGRFITEGGPIQLTTQTGQPGGNINLYAISKNITFQSGNSAIFTAKQQFQLTAETDISFDSADGSFAVSADSATSVIEANAAGYITITSSGTRTTPYDGVYLEAANNVEIGTIGTDTISVNAENYVIIGDVSRPIVTINAGGSPTVTGISITSDGDISTVSENVVQFDINGELIYNGATSIVSYSSGPSNIISTGTDGLGEDILLSAALGTIRLEGDFFDLEAPNGIKSTTSGILHINQLGDTRNDKILMNAPLVTFENQGNFLWVVDHVDADLSSTYSLTTKGPGAIIGENGGRSTLVFQANSLFTIKSGDLLTFTSQKTYGEIDFKTTGAASTLTLQTALQSSIEVTSADTINIFGDTTTFTAGDKITFESQDAIPNVNAPNGDIAFYTTGSINATSQSDVSFSTDENVNILTTSFDEGVGFPLRFTATDELNIQSALDTTIQNTYNEGGSIQFEALSDITIENSQASGELISFTADGQIGFNVARDYTVNVLSNGFTATVASDVSFTATGIDTVDDFGIQFITESQGDNLDFRSLFGDVSFTASDSITITADLNNLDSTTSTLNIETRQSGSFTTAQDMTIDASENILSETRAGSTYFKATNEFLVATSSSTSLIDFQTNGVDDNGLFAIKYTATAIQASVEVTSLFGAITVESSEALVLQGEFVDISSFKPVLFNTVFGEILVEAQLNVTYFTYEDIILSSAFQTEFISGGTIYANSDGDVSFFTENVDIDIRTTGTDADLFFYSSGNMEWDAQSYFLARTAELPGSDVKLTTTLAHINIEATSNNFGINLNFLSSFGNLTVSSTGDDGDEYINAGILDIHADGDIVFESALNIPGSNIYGVRVNVQGTMTVTSELLTYYGASLDFDAGTSFTISSSNNNVGGSINIVNRQTYTAQATGDITFRAAGEGSNVLFETENGDFNFYPRQNNVASYTTTISADSIMKIPNNDYPGTSNYNGNRYQFQCRPGEMFFTSDTNVNQSPSIRSSDSYVCMCLEGINPFDGLYCVRFKEPPFNFVYL